MKAKSIPFGNGSQNSFKSPTLLLILGDLCNSHDVILVFVSWCLQRAVDCSKYIDHLCNPYKVHKVTLLLSFSMKEDQGTVLEPGLGSSVLPRLSNQHHTQEMHSFLCLSSHLHWVSQRKVSWALNTFGKFYCKNNPYHLAPTNLAIANKHAKSPDTTCSKGKCHHACHVLQCPLIGGAKCTPHFFLSIPLWSGPL